MNNTWKDVTTYSQGDRERVPTTWLCFVTPDIRIVVTNHHRYHPGEWVMHCAPWFDTYPIGACVKTPGDAQRAAVDLVRRKVTELTAAFAA